ncbi:hypothetical protein LEP48_07850 [Isoptericola sp. NEAU-Y5]|uniref:Uncharacterized protein n=1 Tax=Isoptericola luteus TaxID=2879484 RepID=A0ABS7ZFI3_9MICO|nr:hypothetical protein [Isoptericola sp. NEAU-Y5]MCA5893272.1 hypothetical protein [Isoptericola sp. NEAU-Y5]
MNAPPAPSDSRPWVPPRWFVRAAWTVQRGMYRLSRGRLVLRRPRAGAQFAAHRGRETPVVVLEPR